MKKILIMGLPGSGKTTLARDIIKELESMNKTLVWFNADQIREQFNDWDFTEAGRIRQSVRMSELAAECDTDYVICDFVAPLKEMRDIFDADWTIWLDTIDEGRFSDTNKMFELPTRYDFRISEQNSSVWSKFIVEHIVTERRRPVFDFKKETVQMLGRWQPWHAGHRALFERLLKKTGQVTRGPRTGQVIIQIRDVQGWQNSNPFALSDVEQRIRRDLDPLYQGQYEIQIVPNIVHIGWGRGVGYTSGEEHFDEEITKISGTQIRKNMGLE